MMAETFANESYSVRPSPHAASDAPGWPTRKVPRAPHNTGGLGELAG